MLKKTRASVATRDEVVRNTKYRYAAKSSAVMNIVAPLVGLL